MSEIIEIEGISLPKNDYQQPTEIRDWVVREIVGVAIKNIQNKLESTLGIGTSGTIFLHNISPNFREHCPEAPSKEVEPYIQVRGVEMQKVWRVLQGAGYYLYVTAGSCYDSYYNSVLPTTEFHWDKCPYWRNRTGVQDAEFTYFIDK